MISLIIVAVTNGLANRFLYIMIGFLKWLLDNRRLEGQCAAFGLQCKNIANLNLLAEQYLGSNGVGLKSG